MEEDAEAATVAMDIKHRFEMARLDQEERETEIVDGDNWEYDLHQHMTLCNKYPDHKDFIPINQLALEHMPLEWQEAQALARVQHMGLFTVRLVTRYTSSHRPDALGFDCLKGTYARRVGTGKFVSDIFDLVKTQPCPIQDCVVSPKKDHLVSVCFKIETASHVVYNNEEACATTVEFFYDDDKDKQKVVTGYGICVENVDVQGDQSVLCCVTHDLCLLDKLLKAWDEINDKCGVFINILPEWPEDKLEQLVEESERSRVSFFNMHESPLAFVISHPHGCAKHVTFGELVFTDVLALEENKDAKVDGENDVKSSDEEHGKASGEDVKSSDEEDVKTSGKDVKSSDCNDKSCDADPIDGNDGESQDDSVVKSNGDKDVKMKTTGENDVQSVEDGYENFSGGNEANSSCENDGNCNNEAEQKSREENDVVANCGKDGKPNDKNDVKSSAATSKDKGASWQLENASKCKLHYTIPTCPGSSGAPVYVYHETEDKNQQCVAPHSRHSRATNVNVSGVGYVIHGKPQ